MDDPELAGKLRTVGMTATALALLDGVIDRATVIERLRHDSYGRTDARWELADAINERREEAS